MNTIFQLSFLSVIGICLAGCSESEFLDKKPSTNIVQPTSLTDFQNLLDNTLALNVTGGLAQLAADEYVLTTEDWLSTTPTERNSYVWASVIYEGENGVDDWNELYTGVFYANCVLDGLTKSDSAGTARGQFIKGWALFTRAFAFYDLTRNFCKAYDEETASNDLGIPIRLSSDVSEILPRSTLGQSYEQILSDLGMACRLLPPDRPSNNLNRPSRLAAYALFARIYLDMRKYEMAELYADSCLALYNVLVDYNMVDANSDTPFPVTFDEIIYNSRQVSTYFNTTNSIRSPGKINPELIGLYAPGDLRLLFYFQKSPQDTYTKKSGYGSTRYHFTGLATDEVYLIKAECLARRAQVEPAMGVLNELMANRYSDSTLFSPLQAQSAEEALEKVLLERQKELVWRGLRWHDLKRLNMEGWNITLERTVNGTTYTLPPNDPRYIFPIPDDEIALSGIKQNVR